MPTIWIAQLRISQATSAKLRNRHGLSPRDVSESLICRAGLPFAWDYHHERGKRAIVRVRLGDQNVLCVLYPLGDGIWNLGSAYPERRQR